MYRITVPKWIDKQSGVEHPAQSFNAELVEVLLAKVAHPAKVIFEYYGEDAPASVFKRHNHDRLVFQSDNGEYFVIPNTPANYDLWAELV